MSDDVRGSEPVMTTKEAILEIRGDMKVVLEFVAAQKQASLPKRMTDVESEIDDLKAEMLSERSWRRGLGAAGGLLALVLIILQVTNMVAVASTP